MDKKYYISIIISILIGFTMLSGTLFFTFRGSNSPSSITKSETAGYSRYEMISANDSNLIIFDKETGKVWRKFIEDNEGPVEWSDESPDFMN